MKSSCDYMYVLDYSREEVSLDLNFTIASWKEHCLTMLASVNSLGLI